MRKLGFIAFGLCLAASSVLAQVPRSNHVVMVMEENHGYSSVIGSSSMPYLNSLAQRYGLATQYYANTHPSIGNYFMLTTGQILTNNDSSTMTVTSNNIVQGMMSAGKSWKSYAEDLPYAGYTGGDTNHYMKHHNPFAYFADVRNSSNEKFNLVPFPQFHTDLQNGRLPEFSYIVPNSIHDAHSGSLSAADAWLKQNIAPLLANAQFQQDGLLVIVFDEASDSDGTRGGGHVVMMVVGPKVRSGFRSTRVYQHQSTLRLIMTALGMSSFPGAASSAPSMTEFFASGTTPPNPGTCSATSTGVRVCSPVSGSTMGSPVKISAGAAAPVGIASMMVYVDNQARYTTFTNSVSTSLSMSAGTHSMVVKAWDHQGHMYTDSLSVKAN